MKGSVDFDYRQIKSFMLIQQMYRYKRDIVSKINKKQAVIYFTINSIISRVVENYNNHILSQEQYNDMMNQCSKLVDMYKSVPNPLTVSDFYRKGSDYINNLQWKTGMIEYKLVKLSMKCGVNKCSDILNLVFGENWNLGLKFQFQKLLKFYDSSFVPISFKIQKREKEEVLPHPVEVGLFTNSILLRLNGADLYIPLMNKTIVIRGYFRPDPLNIARIGGTLEIKYESLIKKLKELKRIPASFRDSYMEYTSLRDFVCFDNQTLVDIVTASYDKIEKIKNTPVSEFVTDFMSKSPVDQSRLLTLLLISASPEIVNKSKSDSDEDDTIYLMIHSVVNTLRNEVNEFFQPKLDEIYRSLHWSVQEKFQRVIGLKMYQSASNIQLAQDSDLPYEKRLSNLKLPESGRRKANDKLKEVQKSKDGNEKATMYLDNLLKVPFGVYKSEPIISFLSEFKVKTKTFIEDAKEFERCKQLTSRFDMSQITSSDVNTSNQVEKFMLGPMQQLDSVISEVLEENEIEEDMREFLRVRQRDIKEFVTQWSNYKEERHNYMSNLHSRENLGCIHGQDEAKKSLEQIFAQWVNGEQIGAVFGFHGDPGVGKTSLGMQGLAHCLLDAEGKPRPSVFISLGGEGNASFLTGSNYTYVGSKHGKIVDALIEAECMNPIIIFDEADKLSEMPHGKEIIGVLIHLTDPTQNHKFRDKYFDMEFDLSKCLIILSYNDESALDPILRDRITKVPFNHLNNLEKNIIAKDYMLPTIYKHVGFSSDEIIFSDEQVNYVINQYVYEAGVRKLKEKLFEIIRGINVKHMGERSSAESNTFPITVTSELIDEILKKTNKVEVDQIPAKPMVGWVNGLFATRVGTGGLTIIQTTKTPTERKLDFEMTGNLKDVMKESIRASKTVSWNLLPVSVKKKINDECRLEGSFGIHIHFPSAAVPKDGPSAGAAITLATVSQLCGLKVRNYIAMTGEIDLFGNIGRIGGVRSKIEGAIKAGAKIVLMPYGNRSDWEEISHNFEDDVINVFFVKHISKVIQVCLITDAGCDKFNYQMTETVEPELTNLIEKYDMTPAQTDVALVE